MRYRCPLCKKIIRVSSEKQFKEARFFPFCSRRCKLIDLGAWLDAKYKVTSELNENSSDTLTDKP
jgi:hypothetical protein